MYCSITGPRISAKCFLQLGKSLFVVVAACNILVIIFREERLSRIGSLFMSFSLVEKLFYRQDLLLLRPQYDQINCSQGL